MYVFLITAHLIGTILGVGGATMIEVHLHQALRNGQISDDEKGLLKMDYMVVRVGLVIAILSGFGFLLLYKMTGDTAQMFSPILWTKLAILIFIAGNTLLLQARQISIFWGAGISFVSWWLAAIFGIFSTNEVRVDFFGQGSFLSSFLSLMLTYVALVIIGSVVLHYFRKTVS